MSTDRTASEVELYNAIVAYLRTPLLATKLRRFWVDPDDAAAEIWLRLLPYVRKTLIRNYHGYVREFAPKIVNRVIDQELRHQKDRYQGVLV